MSGQAALTDMIQAGLTLSCLHCTHTYKEKCYQSLVYHVCVKGTTCICHKDWQKSRIDDPTKLPLQQHPRKAKQHTCMLYLVISGEGHCIS